MPHQPHGTDPWNLPRGINLFTRQVGSDRISQQLQATALDPAERLQHGGDAILLGDDSLALRGEFGAVTFRQARKFGFAQVEPDLHPVRAGGARARWMRRLA